MSANNIVIAVRLNLDGMGVDEKLSFVDETSRGIEQYIDKHLCPKLRVRGYSMTYTIVEIGHYQQAHAILVFAKHVMDHASENNVGMEQALWTKIAALAGDTGLGNFARDLGVLPRSANKEKAS